MGGQVPRNDLKGGSTLQRRGGGGGEGEVDEAGNISNVFDAV